MRTLILYSTKSGACRECAEMLAREIKDTTVFDLKEKVPDITEFDIVIMGSGIRMGGAYKPFKKFLKENENILLKKDIAFFITNMQTDKFEKIIENNIPEKLRGAAFCIKTFGGKVPFGGKKDDREWMLMDEVNAFVRAVKEKM